MDAEERQVGPRRQHCKMFQGVQIRPEGKRKLEVSMAFAGKEAFVTASFRRMTGKTRLHLFEK